jgi:hypothetical protein
MFITAVICAFFLLLHISTFLLIWVDKHLDTTAGHPVIGAFIAMCITYLLVYYNVL